MRRMTLVVLVVMSCVVAMLVLAGCRSSAETSPASTTRVEASTTITEVASTTTDSGPVTGTQATTAAATGPEGPQPLDMLEVGFSSFGDHEVFGAIIKNPNPDHGTSSGTLRVTLRDASGGVITYDQTFPHIMPGQAVAWGGTLSGNGQTITGSGSEVLSLEAGDWIPADQMEPVGFVPFEIVGLKENKTASPAALVFTGEVANGNPVDLEKLAVTVLLRDQEGLLIGGGTGFVENVPAGGKAPFEVDIPRDMLNYGSYEAYAQIW